MNLKFKNWWDKASPEEVERHQSKLLQKLITTRVAPFSKYYREMFEREGIDPASIQSTDDLVRLPFTFKRDLGETKDFVIVPEKEVLQRQSGTFLKMLRHGPRGVKKVLEDELRPIFMTSTTGRSSAPVPFLYTQQDIAILEESGRRLMEMCGATPDFKIVNAFPFAPHLAFWQAHYAGTGDNKFTLSTGGGKVMGTSGNVEVIAKIQPDAIIAMPTFLYHLLQKAAEGKQRWPNLKRLVLGGEKVPEGMRRKLRTFCAELGADKVDILSTYAFTEAKMAWAECAAAEGEESAGFHLYPDLSIIEVVDPNTGERVPDGHPGEIVYTPLQSRGSIVLRYRTGDLIEGGIVRDLCPICGRTCPRLVGKISRVSDIHRLNIGKLKGTLVDFNQLENLLDDTEGLGAWQLELRKENDDPLDLDEIIIHAVPMDCKQATLAENIRQKLKNATELSPNDIRFYDWKTMRKMQGVGKELKEKKVIDNRPK
ncbi:AMP-binding protein [Verrucomicrobiaceae bacterium 5K15]|uniref:AMP-binding protein n=1 Tax=Oceaniferula flava TaxID=2800421 RepID=A0AAE2SFB6_9BACT|nr:AMP-binding protein [Oceaniferula flavus]MBK1855947.1 AMP-binding protein [Oceaniferula flavus]MBM1137254.1 AMP-binding protein [Oceaniferula flavus]